MAQPASTIVRLKSSNLQRWGIQTHKILAGAILALCLLKLETSNTPLLELSNLSTSHLGHLKWALICSYSSSTCHFLYLDVVFGYFEYLSLKTFMRGKTMGRFT